DQAGIGAATNLRVQPRRLDLGIETWRESSRPCQLQATVPRLAGPRHAQYAAVGLLDVVGKGLVDLEQCDGEETAVVELLAPADLDLPADQGFQGLSVVHVVLRAIGNRLGLDALARGNVGKAARAHLQLERPPGRGYALLLDDGTGAYRAAAA